MTARPTLAEPVIVSRFWKNRSHDAIGIELSTFENRNVIDVRVYVMHEGRLMPTKKGVSLSVLRLPELQKAITKALRQARALGLIDDDGASAWPRPDDR
jgi:hypothetical protein